MTKRKELAPIISNFLFHKEDDPIAQKKAYVTLKIEIRDSLQNPQFRKILSAILIDLQKDVSGAIKDKVNALYRELELHFDAYEKLQSRRWARVAQGILELTQMQVLDAYPFIAKFINDKRGIVRKQAEIAIVSLKSEGIDHFLDITRYGISEWQQLKLIEVLRAKHRFTPPNFKAWLVSSNRDVVLFALRLIKQYNQNDAVTAIVELLKHKDDKIKEQAIKCIKEFCVLSALPILKAIYWKAKQGVKIEILDTIATLGSESDLEFLKKVAQKAPTFLIGNKVAMAINTIAPNTILPSKDIISEDELPFEKEMKSVFGDENELQETIEKIAEEASNGAKDSKESVEKQEIEVFEIEEEMITSPQREPRQEEVETFSGEEAEPQIEIGLLPQQLDSSINNEIGLVPNASPSSELGKVPNEGFEKIYSELDTEDKDRMVDTFENTASEEDIPLLQNMMEEEPSSERRFRIFKILKSIVGAEKNDFDEVAPSIENSDTEESSEEVPRLGQVRQSIFYDLFEYASDLDSQLILFKEMAEIGDEKELPFLSSLKEHKEAIIRISAMQTEEIIQNRLAEEQRNSKGTEEDSISDPVKHMTNEQELYDGRMPLELCFLYEEFDIAPPEEEETFQLNFSLHEEFYAAQKTRTTPGD